MSSTRKKRIERIFGDMNMSPYLVYGIDEWAEFRADTPLTLSEPEVERLRSLNDPIALDEVQRIYLSLSRLLSSHVESAQSLYLQRRQFLSTKGRKTPFVIGIAGSVAVGKSTTARILRELLARWPSSPKVDLVTTDGFLFSNEELRKRGIMGRKGFPESFDRRRILSFLTDIKSGRKNVKAPLYSHLVYDVLEGETVTVDRPDILIFEGINVLQTSELPKDGRAVPFVSDFFDFSIYIDAEERHIQQWYLDRFMRLRETAFQDPKSFFHRYSDVSEDSAMAIAEGLWENINLRNLHDNILPTRLRADLILHKGEKHAVDMVALRRI